MNRLLTALGPPEWRERCITHTEVTPAGPGSHQPWPEWVPEELTLAYGTLGIDQPWAHQVEAMEAAQAGRHTVIATSTGSGKSLALWTPVLAAISEPPEYGSLANLRHRPTALYLAPTKALAADQLATLRAVVKAGALDDDVTPVTCDGDTPRELRQWAQGHANAVLTNPDYLHFALLPHHQYWGAFLRGLAYVVVDELHAYRGVMGAHVAMVLRRLRRLAWHYGSNPVFLFASATVSEPAVAAGRLIGEPPDRIAVIDQDTSAHGEQTLVLWKPRTLDTGTDAPADLDEPQRPGTRLSAPAEAAHLLARLTDVGARTVAFVRSRYSAEAVADAARHALEGQAQNRIATYRGGYLAEERRDLEARLRNGSLLAVVSTSALELGIDISGLDAVLIAGWPGTRVALRQQAGRAGRAGADGLAVWIAGVNPLDTYVVDHPQAVVGAPLEATVFDPSNPYVLAPHLAAAAAELPLDEAGLALFGSEAPGVVGQLEAMEALRRRGPRWFWVLPDAATNLTDLRGAGGAIIQVVEEATGRVLGTVDEGRAPATVHPGAVYLHQGESFVVETLDIKGGLATVRQAHPRYRTMPLDQTAVTVVDDRMAVADAAATWHFGLVDVRSQVTGFNRLRLPGLDRIDTVPLDDPPMPPSTLRTAATWCVIPNETLQAAGLTPETLPGALHAAEHAAIGLLPLLATCDRWDLGGLSAAYHADTGQATIFVHDAVPGGAGFAQRGFEQRAALLAAVLGLLQTCPCEAGCPACIQSPKCGNGNQLLDKAAALALVQALVPDASSPG
ncbi:MAG: DEAD/DEAH box helicase [Bifidobacteriaceae bacterium]|nr:DEAD/DEAH box helicase [Bifidobacteriaceae bacterium]